MDYVVEHCEGNTGLVGRVYSVSDDGTATAPNGNKLGHFPDVEGWPAKLTNANGTVVSRVLATGTQPAHDGKLDAGKVDPRMLFRGCATALRKVLAVLEFGAKKYAANSWQKVPNALDRYEAAFQRHKMDTDVDFWSRDPETGEYHVAHMVTNLLFLLELKHKEDNANS